MNAWFNGRRARLLTSAAGGVALMFAAAGAAQAQDTNDDEVIVVTGFRASLRSSTETKREADAIVEAITAEDIGKLPDNSIAESLARLPGLTAQRLFGRSQQISVRGLSPDFTTALLNGREQVSAGDNRGVEYDQYPSELINQAVVYKTPTAGLIGQGLAGTVDLRTVRPLAYDETVFALNARYEWNEYGALNAGSDESGYRITGAYIDQTDDGRWGWALGVATMSSPTQAERFEAWGYPTTGLGEFVLGGAKPYVQSSTLERDGYLGVIEFRPSSTFSSRIDAFYSEFDEAQTLRGIEIPLWWSGAQLQPGYTVEDGLVTAGTFNNTEAVVRNDVRSRHAVVQAIGWNMQFDLSDRWSLETDLSYSSVERDDVDLETYSGTGPGAQGANASMGFARGNGSFVFNSNLNYADPNLIMLTDPAGWGQAGFIKQPQTDDELTALRVSVERQLDNGPFSSWEFGINYSQREKNKDSIENFVDLIGGNNQSVPIPSSFLQSPTALNFLGIPGMVSYDPIALLNNGGVYTLRPLIHSDVVVKAWGVEEDVTVFYTQLNVDTEFGGIPTTGNVGIQFVDTDQSSSGGVLGPNGAVRVESGDSYLEMLPSLNLSFNVAEDTYLRLGIARTLARARMDDMRASFAVGYNPQFVNNATPTSSSNSYWGGGGGNPRLRPWIADSVDLSFERYLGDSGGYIAIAGFYKYLESYIYPESIPYDFTGFPVGLINGVPATPATRQGFATAPQNGSGGYLQGIEFTANIPFELFSPALEGFGIVLNAAHNDSDIQPPNTPGSALPGLSENIVNTTLYFERSGFEARVSNRYRTDFLGEVTGFGAGRELRMIKGESILDAQIGYRFESGPLEGLAIQFQANNITDEPFTSFVNDDERLVRDYQSYGANYLFGFSYRH